MDEYPRMLFRCPGPETFHGGSFATLIVHDDDGRDAALADGWRLTTDEAKAAHEEPPAEPEATEDAPPSRAELEQKAAELGIKFDGRTSDAKLAEKIAAALKD